MAEPVTEYLVMLGGDVKALDRAAFETGIPFEGLMESAGTHAAAWVIDHFTACRTAVLAGPGGNGGDAMVVARHLSAAGFATRTFLVGSLDRLGEAARVAARRLIGSGVPVVEVSERDLEDVKEALSSAELIVDGLFGIGAARPLASPFLDLAETVNRSTARTVALDLPSGIHADSGAVAGPSVRANVTLALAFLKPAHLLYPARERCGNVAIVPVDYPSDLVRMAAVWARVPEAPSIRARLPRRAPDGHKGTFGHVLVVAGSIGMTGAAILCCRGALRSGAGKVTLAAPASLNPILEAALPEALTLPLPDRKGRLVSSGFEVLEDSFARADAVVIGPGLSRDPETSALAARTIQSFSGPFVVDADALHAVADRPEVLAELSGRAVLTPHPGEFSRLIQGQAAGDATARVEEARAFAKRSRLVLLLKGRPTVVADSHGELHLNPTGNTGLATGGSGDVLAGMIGALIAGGASPVDAAIAAAYLHGRAADIYARDQSERAMIASDLVNLLPTAFREVERCG